MIAGAKRHSDKLAGIADREPSGKPDLDGFAARGQCEFIEEFARPLPTAVFLGLMGWPQEDAPQLLRWTHDIIEGKPGGTDEESNEVRTAAGLEVYTYFAELLDNAYENPGDDIISQLTRATFNGEREPIRIAA